MPCAHQILIANTTGYHIGCVYIMFGIPQHSFALLFPTGDQVPKHLAHVEWYTAFTNELEPNSHLFKILPMKDRDGGNICSIIPLANIWRSVHLIPKFGEVALQEWTSRKVLDLATVFLVNKFTNVHLYCVMCWLSICFKVLDHSICRCPMPWAAWSNWIPPQRRSYCHRAPV